MDIVFLVIKIASYLLLIAGAGIILDVLRRYRLLRGTYWMSQEQMGCLGAMFVIGLILIGVWGVLFFLLP